MDIQRDNFFSGRIYEDSFMNGKCYCRPRLPARLENGQVMHLPALPHKRFNRIPDLTRSLNYMTFGNGVTWSTFPTIILGPRGLVCNYDGVAMYGRCQGNPSLSTAEAITVEAYVKTASSADNMGIISKMDSARKNGFSISMDGGLVRALIGYGTGYIGITSDVNTYNDNKRHRVVLKVTTTTTYMFVDGKEQSSIVTVDMTNQDLPVDIGRKYSTYNAYYFNGIIDSPIISKLALSAAKQRDNYWRAA